MVAEQLTNSLTDPGITCFKFVKPTFAGLDPNTVITVEQKIATGEVPKETVHLQKTLMWRDICNFLTKDESDRLMAHEEAVREWDRKFWIKLSLADKLMVSARLEL
ncbi:hypothetical protein JKF63_04824 [Porcisia hertigi]|uniref:Uncharacterized protein n=1 Tax=Porcisia hertigi TaxID=2761500 RepID=A0A836IVC3_9TRYP|nr:hypothetical protein JKF63_04824 [Porcisia hertigi]